MTTPTVEQLTLQIATLRRALDKALEEVATLERTVLRVEAQYGVQYGENEKLRAKIQKMEKTRTEDDEDDFSDGDVGDEPIYWLNGPPSSETDNTQGNTQ